MLPRLGCGGPPCSPMPHSPEECRRLRTCSECLARHPRTLQPGDGEVSCVKVGGGWDPPCSLAVMDRMGRAGWGGVLGSHRACLPHRHLPHAVSGVPTALRVPALGAMDPAPQRMTVASISERSSGLGTAPRPPAGLPTASSAPGRASACGRGSSRGQVGTEAWSLRGELGAWTPESEGEGLGPQIPGYVRRSQGPGLSFNHCPTPRGDSPHPLSTTHL